MIPASAHDRLGWAWFDFGRGLAVLAVTFAAVIRLATIDVATAKELDQRTSSEVAATAADSQSEQGRAKNGQTKLADDDREQKLKEGADDETAPMIREVLYLSGDDPVYRIGATAVVTEVSTGMPFPARVDTGATTCSIHCEEMEIEDAADDARGNIGKRIRFKVKNDEGTEKWINAKIVDHVVVRTSEEDDERYKVRLKLRWQDIEKRVLVTLNDRERMKYPLLLGRNFLSGDFVVDVGLDGDSAE